MLTSTFKLFLREMVEPLIPELIRDELCGILVSKSDENRKSTQSVGEIKETLKKLDTISYKILKYLIFHLQVIAEVKGKKNELFCFNYLIYTCD